jgi:hypothetical protein
MIVGTHIRSPTYEKEQQIIIALIIQLSVSITTKKGAKTKGMLYHASTLLCSNYAGIICQGQGGGSLLARLGQENPIWYGAGIL